MHRNMRRPRRFLHAHALHEHVPTDSVDVRTAAHAWGKHVLQRRRTVDVKHDITSLYGLLSCTHQARCVCVSVCA